MDKLEKVVKGKNIKHMLDAFFNKYIKKHFNEVHSIDFIISDLGEKMGDGGRNIKILRNDNPVRTNNPDWFPPKAQQTDHICTFLKQLMDNNLGTKDSYVGLKVDVVTPDKTYTWDVKAVDYYASSGTVILKTDPRQGVTIECPAIVRLYIYPLLTSKAISSIVYDSIVTSESKYNFILGERNIHKGEDNVWIFGKNNLSGETNHNSLINGYNNDIESYGNIVIGDANKHRSLLGATIGRYIKNFKQHSFLFGEGHDNSEGPSHEAVFGKYSKIESDTIFAIGDGEDKNTRHNLFEIKAGGAILDKDGNDIRNSGGQQVQSDWNEIDNSKPAYIKNKPTIPTPVSQEQSDWNESNSGKPSFIKNKPTIPDAQVQADWNETDSTKKSFIKNKPNINSSITNITWSELITLRNNGGLIPGMQYRITDYITTTAQENTQSAGHQFDIIVIADSKNKLNENARACLHEKEAYFNDCKLESWRLKYCIDNDTNRFSWADLINGKGVIYRMIDEWNNDCPYDFKNIQFIRYKILECPKSPSAIGYYALPFINDNNNVIVDKEDFKYFYTFTSDIYSMTDSTIFGKINNASILPLILPLIQNSKRSLNDNIFIGEGFDYIELNIGCSKNTFYNVCFIKFDKNCSYNIIGYGAYNNSNTNNSKIIFEDLCINNWIGNSCVCKFERASDNFIVGGSKITFGFLCYFINVLVPYVEGLIVGSYNYRINITSERTVDVDNKLRNIIIASRVNNPYGDDYKTISHNIVNNTFQTIYKPVGSQEIEV